MMNPRKKAIQFGAGNIGRGYIGDLLHRSGYEIIFVDINEEIVSLLNERQRYTIEVIGEETVRRTVNNFWAVDGSNPELVADEFPRATIVTTAVGPSALKYVAPVIARGIKRRKEEKIEVPLNIIACENMNKASSALKQLILEELDKETINYVRQNIGFPNAEVSKMVLPENEKNDNGFSLSVEEYEEFIVEREGFTGEIPEIAGMKLVDNIEPYVERKIFTLSEHAITAYLGYQKGYKYICEALKNREIRLIVEGALQEAGKVLIAKDGFSEDEYNQYIQALLRRHGDPRFKDTILRVAREPIRKLGKDERFIKPAQLAIRYGINPGNLVKGIVAVLRFEYDRDEQAKELNERIKGEGLENVLMCICELKESDKLFGLIKEEWERVEETK